MKVHSGIVNNSPAKAKGLFLLQLSLRYIVPLLIVTLDYVTRAFKDFLAKLFIPRAERTIENLFFFCRAFIPLIKEWDESSFRLKKLSGYLKLRKTILEVYRIINIMFLEKNKLSVVLLRVKHIQNCVKNSLLL